MAAFCIPWKSSCILVLGLLTSLLAACVTPQNQRLPKPETVTAVYKAQDWQAFTQLAVNNSIVVGLHG